MLAFLSEWPSWAVYAAVGGVMGAIGGAAGYFIAKKSQKASTYCTILAIIASKPITEHLIIPQINIDVANADLPKKIDSATTLTNISFRGGDVTYYFEVDKTSPLTSKDDLKTIIGLPACSFWKDKFASREFTSAEYAYAFSDGTAKFTLTPDDCQ